MTNPNHPHHEEYQHCTPGLINLIKAYREINLTSLKDAKDAIENCRDYGKSFAIPYRSWGKFREVMTYYKVIYSVDFDHAYNPVKKEKFVCYSCRSFNKMFE